MTESGLKILGQPQVQRISGVVPLIVPVPLMINLVVIVILLMPASLVGSLVVSLAANMVVNLVGTLVMSVTLVITATMTGNASIVTLTWSEETMIEPATVIGTIIPTIIMKSTTLTVVGYVLCRF